ncbi:MAG: PAS domain S-box protein [Bacteroidetes bacterium]|nr:MAG: PAS domain S-box protein [Bacteroidota bacterium]REK06487.1 MAG: PAS domain S-box protein [Bacteroidota bacterium]REK33253.1 MAG: PAS domain S-box protein [Bacteroidota bacterium]REK47090.1 MAG: PAS domain S-box protein [Bacteroidota bacterium]
MHLINVKIRSALKHLGQDKIYGSAGFLIGLIFPIVAFSIHYNTVGRGFSFIEQTDTILNHYPALWIIFLAPIVMALFGHRLGRKNIEINNIIREKLNNKYKNLIEEAGDVVYSADYKGNFTYFNQRIYKAYGYTPEELVGKHFTCLIVPDMMDEVSKFYLNQFRSRTPETISELQIIDKSGEKRWVEQTVILIQQDDYVSGFHCVVRDISQRKIQENSIIELNNKLSEKLKELEFTNQELEAFNHTVTHDLKSPLRGINSLIDMINEDYSKEIPKDALELFYKIRSNIDRIQVLIDDLLEFSRSGKATLSKEKVDMKQILNDTILEFTITDPSRTVEIRIKEIPHAFCDEKLIRQVWKNYISNAFKYSSKVNNPVIESGSYIDGDKIVYYVRDNGTGFNMKYYNKLFTTFNRLHNYQDYEGSGVGLSIVKRIIEKHNGSVWAEGKPGEGATFYFSLPDVNACVREKKGKTDMPVFHNYPEKPRE